MIVTGAEPASLLLVNVGQLLTLTGPGLGVIEGGQVRVRDGIIAEVGPGLGAAPGERELDCRGGVVLPGFVDPHSHPVFGGWRHEEFEQRLAGRSYREIAEAGGGILNSVRQTRRATEDELVASGRQRLDEMLDWGTTTVEAKSGYGAPRRTPPRAARSPRTCGRRPCCRA
ncbi:MAG: imidazolonepropionase, partial [bacterium]